VYRPDPRVLVLQDPRRAVREDERRHVEAILLRDGSRGEALMQGHIHIVRFKRGTRLSGAAGPGNDPAPAAA
jgi:hypothetical protein